jgi:alpha-glucoside transport system substrate-binding protein
MGMEGCSKGVRHMRHAAIRILFLAVSLGLIGASVQAQNLVFPIGEDARFAWSDLERFEDMDLSGQTIQVFGPWLGPDRDLVLSIFAYFEQATGANIDYAGSDSFEQQIVIDTQAGSPPHVAIFPQPGLAADLASRGNLIPLGDELRDWTLENYAAGQSWVDLGTYEDADGNDDFFGFFYKVDLKSLVWYSPDNFADAGYEIPATMEELIALSDRIVADGDTPWCIGLGSGDATGWPATDWVEDILLRTQPPEVYDGWVTNEIPFNDPRIVNAIETFGSSRRTTRTSTAAPPPSGPPTSATARPASSPCRRAATCTARRASSPPSSPRAPSSASTPTSSTSRPSPARTSATPSSAPAPCGR